MFQKLVLMIRSSKTQASNFAVLERLPQGQHKELCQVEGPVLHMVVEGDRGHLGSNLGFDSTC